MFFIQIKDLQKSFGEKILLKNLNLTISSKEKIGIIGKNGEGKTTLLKIIAGEIQSDSGQIIFSQENLKIAYHTQYLPIEENEFFTIENYILKNFPEIYSINQEINSILSQKKNIDTKKLIELQSNIDEFGGYQILDRIEKSLITLGLNNFSPNDLVQNLSGGQKTRLQLAKIIVQNPDILLLDEPTNHLDAESIDWLTNFIQKRNGITIIISHDRNFLNNSISQILEIENGNTNIFTGNYDNYLLQKQNILDRNAEEIKRNLEKVGKLDKVARDKKSLALKQHFQKPDKKKYGRHSRTIMRNKAGKKARQARIVEKKVDEKIERNSLIKPENIRKMKFSIESSSSQSDFVLKIKDFDVKIENKLLIKSINLEIKKGERIAISGSNGSGKTTLLKQIIKESENNSEKISIGRNTKFAYYSQEHESLDLDLTVLEDFRKDISMLEKDASNYLFKMLFTFDQMKQKVKDLSQGEKSKLALAKFLAQENNFLILDEPTNHLDIASREILEEALKNYEGSILCVSHDKYFLEKIGIEKKIEIKNQKINLK